jgi:hypothetical protein
MPIFGTMRLTVLAWLLTHVLAGHAQAFRTGPRLGLGLCTRSAGGLFSNTNDLMAGPMLGWHFDLPLHPQVSLMPEILWMTKGFVVRDPAQATRTRTTLRYLETPVSVKVLTDKSAEGIYLLAGLSVGYLLRGNDKTWLGGELVSDTDHSTPPGDNRWEFSGLVGLGWEGQRWSFDVRAQSSLTPFTPTARPQNVVYALTVAHRLPPRRAAEEPE